MAIRVALRSRCMVVGVSFLLFFLPSEILAFSDCDRPVRLVLEEANDLGLGLMGL